MRAVGDDALLYLAAGCLYAGFQLTIRGLVYPQMQGVPAAAWVAYEGTHTRLVSRIVGPLFGALVLTVVGLLVDRGPEPAVLLAVALLALLLGVTAFGASPLHTRLAERFDPQVHRRLLRWDTLRLALALGQVALGLVLVLGPG